MFTGLIEEVGRVSQIQVDEATGGQIEIAAQTVLNGAQLGDSVALDGVCTTVVQLGTHSFTVEVSPETLAKTTLSHYQVGSRVNLERPLTPTSRLGGHYVTGHVDGIARIVARFQHGNAWVYRFELASEELAAYVVEKGSIAVQGISLTVNTVIGKTFSVAIIPHTLAHTNLDDYGVEDWVNIETDLLGKYVHRLLLQGRIPSAEELDHAGQAKSSRIHEGNWFCHELPAPSGGAV